MKRRNKKTYMHLLIFEKRKRGRVNHARRLVTFGSRDGWRGWEHRNRVEGVGTRVTLVCVYHRA